MSYQMKEKLMKKIILLLISVLILFTSCEQVNLEESVNQNVTGTVTISFNDVQSRTIAPTNPNFASYEVTLIEVGEGTSKSEPRSIRTTSNESVQFDSVKVGSYTVTVDAYDSVENGKVIAQGSQSLAVKGNSNNEVSVQLEYLTQGTGSFSVDIVWNIEDFSTPFGKALESKSVGFLAWDVDLNCALNNASIKWLTDEEISNKGFTWTQDGIPETKGKQIAFRIYTNNSEDNKTSVCIAETFNTFLQIIPNLNSTPDLNEEENFKISDNSLSFFSKNVNPQTVKAEYGSDPASTMVVTWNYPKLSTGNYEGILFVWVKDNNGTQQGATQKFKYNQDTVNPGSATFTGLSTDKTYSVYFYNTSDYGHSTILEAISGFRTRVMVSSINFANEIPSKLSMGGHTDVIAQVLPVTASNRNYTLTVSDGATVSGNKTILFPYSGKYTSTATSDDNPSKIVSKEIVIALANPTVSSECVDDGILVSWDKVEGATSYEITRTGDGNSVEKTVNQTSFTDTDVYTSVNYTYTVVAKCEDSTFDSLPSLETSTTIMGPSISVQLPNELTSVELLSSLKAAAGSNPHMTKSDALSLTLLNEIEGVTDYAWYLNGKKLVSGNFETVKNYTILPTNDYLNTFAVETSNTLMFAVVKDGYTYSATVYFNYIENDPGNVFIKANSSVVKYGEPLTLEAEFENLVSIAPELEWSSSDSSIASVDNGVVTALADGTVTITATIKSTGAVSSVELKSFIPVKDISFNNSLPTNYLVRSKTGVNIVNSLYQSVDLKDYVTVTAANGQTYSAENNLQWTTSDSSIATVVDGVVTPTKDNGKGGVVTITYYTDTRLKEEGVSGSIDIVVRDYGIIYNSKDITGTKTTFSGTAWVWEQKDYTLNLGVNGNSVSSYSEGSLWWCFDHNENKTVDGSAKSTIDFSSNTNAQTVMQVRVTAYTPYISLFIKDVSGNNICEVFFERGA